VRTHDPARPAGRNGSGRAGHGTALERCIRSDASAFFAGTWSKRPLLVERRDDAAFGDLFSLEAVDRILAGTFPRRPAIRLVKAGAEIPVASYVRTVSLGSEWLHDVIDAGRVYDAFQNGATIVVQGLQRYWEPVVRFARDLELALSHPVQVNAYVSPPGERGLGVHYDTHDVFVLQIAGSKRWNVHERAVDDPLPHQRVKGSCEAQESLIETELQPGQSLYIPRGFLHEAIATDRVSVHLTVGMLCYTWKDVIDDAMKEVEDVAAFRAALPVGFANDPAACAPAIAAKLRALAEWIEERDAGALADRLAKRFLSTRAPIRFGQFEQIPLVEALDSSSEVRMREGSAMKIERAGDDGDGTIAVVLGDRTLTMPAALEDALRFVRAGDRFTVTELGTFFEDDASGIAFARRLVREGLLEILAL
jgi:bifunctional lysine-specific demethylase and histidyl-hydroxylase NO66